MHNDTCQPLIKEITMLDIKEIQKQLEDRNLAAVARKLGVTRSWLQAIRSGKAVCSKDTQQKLSDYLEGK